MKVLFFGDSITDMCCIRNPDLHKTYCLGEGYVFDAATLLLKYDSSIEVINAGISGNRTSELLERYDNDVVSVQPDIVSILIGVNDVWHHVLDRGVSYRKFLSNYRELMKNLKAKLPNTKFIIFEPFFLKGPATKDSMDLFNNVYKYAKGAKKIAREFGCTFIKLQSDLDKAAIKYGVEPVLFDGVHTNLIGAEIIANKWFKTFKKII